MALSTCSALAKRITFRIRSTVRSMAQQTLSVPMAGIVTLSVLAAVLPAWGLEKVTRPQLHDLKRAEVVRVINFNTLLVEMAGEPGLKVVHMIGIAPIPLINPAWTTLTGETPMAIYEAGQYLQTGLAGQDIYLEADPRYPSPAGVISAYIWQGQTLMNQDMLVKGHGLLAESPVELKYGSVLKEAADVAAIQGRGVWTFYGPKPRSLEQPDQAETPAETPATIASQPINF